MVTAMNAADQALMLLELEQCNVSIICPLYEEKLMHIQRASTGLENEKYD